MRNENKKNLSRAVAVIPELEIEKLKDGLKVND